MVALDVGRGGRELAEQGHRALPWGEGNPTSGLEWRSSVDIDAGEVVAPRRGGDAIVTTGGSEWSVSYSDLPLTNM